MLLTFSVTSTFAGLLEGTPETASKSILRHLRMSSDIHLIEPASGRLSRFRFEARLESQHGVLETDPDYVSRLRLVWFSDKLDRSIDAVVLEMLHAADWEKVAIDGLMHGL